MASLKCSFCGEGIRYHDEADGTQYIVFRDMDWEILKKSELYVSRYMLDGNQEYFLIWKCKKCGTIHVFKDGGNAVTSAYKPIESRKNHITSGENYIAFSDYDWDTMTETRIYGKDIEKVCPNCKYYKITKTGKHLVITDSEAKEQSVFFYEMTKPIK